mmetsp:Transcript_10769/g.23682  ORF Transcript_10769/g.23682 Transcript_10769/m.23682 type:complete len:118 (-) Transcript_10769:119-472(-)
MNDIQRNDDGGVLAAAANIRPSQTQTNRGTILRLIKSVLATNGIVVRGGHIVRARRRRLHAVAAFIESQLYKAATNWSEYINLRTIELRMSEAMSAYLAQQGRLPVARGGRGRRARA